ncbi:MAG: ABC transporter substrate-binding protein [Alphaproteobacteria bacterium]|nr:ABC transporter substrate-binding protein [Alphaproteobacteria bacterium]
MSRAVAIAALLLAALSAPADAEPARLRAATQLGLTNLPMMVMEHEKFVEARARQHGLGDIEMVWGRLGAGEAMNDALLSGSIDFASGSVPTFLVIWDKTFGNYRVKGIGAFTAMPLLLLVRDPNILSIRDFTDKDRIALPGVQSSSHAVILEMEAERVFGPGNARKLDPLTVSRAHPDAVAAFLSGSPEITAHFSAPPFQNMELEHPGVHRILSSRDVYDGPGTIGMTLATSQFCDANPQSCLAFFEAQKDALDLIHQDRRKAAEIYIEVSKVHETVGNIEKLLQGPPSDYDIAPHGIVQVAAFMHRIGTIKHLPATWQELFFAFAQSMPGS